MATMQPDTNLCVYCYKTVLKYNEFENPENSKYQLEIHTRFINLLSRQLNGPIEAPNVEQEFNCCTDCFIIIGSFCDLYHQVKCLEIKLNWQVDKFYNVMKLADRIPSRVKTFKNTANCDRKIKFRKNIKRKCKTFLSHSLPRALVSIKRPAKVPKIETQITVSHTNILRENTSNVDKANDHSSLNQSHRNEMEHLFIGWISTLSAVFFLCHLQTFESSQVELQYDLLSIDENHEELFHILSPSVNDAEDNSNNGCDSPVQYNNYDGFEEEPITCTIQHVTKQEDIEIETQSFVSFPFEEPIITAGDDSQCKVPESVNESKTTDVKDQEPVNTNSLEFLSPLITEKSKVNKSTKKTPPGKRKLISPTFEGRSLRTKHQCTKCRATFSDVSKYEGHTNSCIQLNEVESDSEHAIGHDDIDDANVKLESYSGSSSEDDSSHLKHLTKQPIKLSPRNRFFCDKYACKKCTPVLRFSNAKCLQYHENYKHSKGRVHVNTRFLQNTDMKLLTPDGEFVPGQYECNVGKCRRNFDLSEDLENHKKLHGTFICLICDRSFEYAVNHIKHEIQHSEAKQQLEDEDFKKGEIFTCKRCEYKNQFENDVVKHYLSDHLELPTIQTKCLICQQIFPHRERVPMQHYINYHDLNRLDDPNNRINCTESDCFAYFLTEEQMHVHWNRQHVAGCTSKESIVLIEKTDATKKKQYANEKQKHKTRSCPYCQRAFMYQSDVRSHIMKKHREEAGYQEKTMEIGKLVISEDGVTVDDIVLEQNAKYFCKVDKCKERFRDKEDSESHSKLHGQFFCNFCENVENFAVDLAIHEMVHVKISEADNSEEKMRKRPIFYKCSRCPYKVGKRIRYLEHFISKHLDLKMDRKRCPICKYVYDHDTYNKAKSFRHLKDGVYRHFIKWHDFTGVEGGEEKCAKRCDSCPALFKTKMQLLYHNEEVHNPDRLKSEDDWGNVCIDCGKDMLDRNGLLKHRRIVHKIKKNFSCEVKDCGKKFETCRELFNHDTSVHRSDEILICTECGKRFFNNFSLLSHMRSHEEKVEKKVVIRKHVCEQCGKSFRDRSQLEIHYRYHKGPESWEFECEICKKKLSTKQKLEEHRRTHTKEKPFVCQVCGVAYAHGHNLRIHVKSKHKEVHVVSKKVDTTNFASWRKGKKLK